MIKLVALYKTPPDIADFEKHYFEKHIPLVQKIPGLMKAEVSRLSGLPGQDSKYHLMAEMYFNNMDELNTGMASPEGKATARDLMSFARDYVVMFYAEIE